MKTIIQGYDYPIRLMTDEDLVNALSITIPLCAELYCGIKKNDFNEDVLVECIAYIQKYYPNLGAIEIKQAFELSASNKFDNVNMRAYYGQFNISMLGDILTAYSKERNKVLNDILDKHQKNLRGDSFWDERDHKNFLAREEVIKEFKQEVENVKRGKSRKFNTYEDIRTHWSKILLDNGILQLPDNKKRELWEEAKKLVIKETKLTASDYNNIYEARGAKQILKNFENPENKTLKQKAEVIYGKLYVWEFLK